jgi:hypothetical protein
MAERSRDVLSNGIEEALSDEFPGRGDNVFSAGISLPSKRNSKYEWVWINRTTKKLVKRTSPR